MTAGYVCVVQNNADTDYLRMAYLQALSCKLTQKKNANFSIITDQNTAEQITDRQRDVFDHVVIMPVDLAADTEIKQANEAQVFNLTPYKQTVKTEADMLFTCDYSFYWLVYGQYDMVFSSNIYTYNNDLIINRSQRHLFDINQLPDIYSAWTYFSYDRNSKDFYDTVRQIMVDWPWYRDMYLVNCRYDTPRTDEVYAIAHKILNRSLTHNTMGFVHMKNPLQNLSVNQPWTEQLPVEIHKDFHVVVGHYRQTRPLHYQLKTFVTDELLDRYEHGYRTRILG